MESTCSWWKTLLTNPGATSGSLSGPLCPNAAEIPDRKNVSARRIRRRISHLSRGERSRGSPPPSDFLLSRESGYRSVRSLPGSGESGEDAASRISPSYRGTSPALNARRRAAEAVLARSAEGHSNEDAREVRSETAA